MLGQLAKRSRAQDMFSLISLVAGRNRKTHLMNLAQRLVVPVEFWSLFGLGEVDTALDTDGVQLSQKRKRIPGHELSGLIKMALK